MLKAGVSLEEVTDNLALKVPELFIAVLISPEPFEKSKMVTRWPPKNRNLHKTLPYCRKWSCSSTFLGFFFVQEIQI